MSPTTGHKHWTLRLASAGCLLAAATYLGYPLFGSGDAAAAGIGWWQRAIPTLSLLAILGGAAAYGLSAARVLPQLPMLRAGVVAFACLLFYRGTYLLEILLWYRPMAPDAITGPYVAFASVPLLVALVYAVGAFRWLSDERA